MYQCLLIRRPSIEDLRIICDSGITDAFYRVEKEVPGKLIVSTIGSILESGI